MTARPLHRWLALGTAAVVAAALAGCAPVGVVCPAIGYVSAVEVQLTGDIAAVDQVQFCDDDGQCSGEFPPDSTPTQAGTDDGRPLVTSTPMPQPAYTATRVAADRWTFMVIGALPDGGTATAYRADATVAGEATTRLDWNRVGGSAQCAAPVEADPIVLRVG